MATSSSYELVQDGKEKEQAPPSTKPTERPWRPGVLRQLPWTGLLALLLGFGCGVAALTVALVSNGKRLDYWRVNNYSVQPTVLLAILVTFANALLGYAFASGITIFWWSGTLSGRTLRQLHASQSRGDSLMALFTLRPVFNAVTVASVFTILLLMDQPLFQRGIRVTTQSSEESTVVNIPISSSPIQVGATGITPDHSDGSRPKLFQPLFAQVVRQYQNRDPLQFAHQGCRGRCDLDVISTGWDVDCIEWETSYRLMGRSDYEWRLASLYPEPPLVSPYTGPPDRQPAFSVNITYHPGSGPGWAFHIDTSVMYKATPGVNGTMRWRNCTLAEALIKYPVEVSNNTLKLKAMSPGTNRTVHRIRRWPESTGQQDTPSTFGGIWRAMESQFAAQANVSFVGAWTSISTQDVASNTYLQASNNATLDSMEYNYAWSDPTDDIISTAHELTLRTAIATSNTLVATRATTYLQRHASATVPDLLTRFQPEIAWPNLTLVNRTTSQDAEVKMTFNETVYEIQPQWLAGALAVIVAACLSILSTYWGWWRLGRPVSMSPLEIAKAFDAPLMQQTFPNGTIYDHLRTVGDKRVRYAFQATIAEQLESDNTERPSLQSRTRSTLDDPVIQRDSSDDVDVPNPSVASTASHKPTIALSRPDEIIELQILQPGAETASPTRLDRGIASSSRALSAPVIPEAQVDSLSERATEAESASSRIHARIEMRLRFAEERHLGDE